MKRGKQRERERVRRENVLKRGRRCLRKEKRINNGMERDRAKGNVYVRRIGL